MSRHFDQLVASKEAQREETRRRIISIMRKIEDEIESNGFYPENKGKLTQREVCRRAGVGDTTLRNRHHHHTRELLKSWLREVARKFPTKTSSAERVLAQRVDNYRRREEKMCAEVLKLRAEREELLAIIESVRGEKTSQFGNG